jgi:hypothetical protein
MADPFSHDTDSTNGAKAPSSGTNGQGDLSVKLPRSPGAEPTPPEVVSPGVRRDVRRAFLILLGSGLLIGLLTATGVVWVMHRLDLIGVPDPQEQS